jgi:hypothetical protein
MEGCAVATAKPASKNSLRDTLRVYQTLFNDHLGDYLRQEEPPTDPRKLKREHLTGRMLHLQPAPEDGGTG